MGEGIEPSYKRHLIPLLYIGRHGQRLPSLGGGGGEALGTGDPLWCGLAGSLVDQIFHGEPRLYQSELIQCQRDHDDIVCSCGGVDMPGGDKIDSSTQVTVC
jgi:hypothetical protein